MIFYNIKYCFFIILCNIIMGFIYLYKEAKIYINILLLYKSTNPLIIELVGTTLINRLFYFYLLLYNCTINLFFS